MQVEIMISKIRECYIHRTLESIKSTATTRKKKEAVGAS